MNYDGGDDVDKHTGGDEQDEVPISSSFELYI